MTKNRFVCAETKTVVLAETCPPGFYEISAALFASYTGPELVAYYNSIANRLGMKPVTKFKDLATGRRRVDELLRTIPACAYVAPEEKPAAEKKANTPSRMAQCYEVFDTAYAEGVTNKVALDRACEQVGVNRRVASSYLCYWRADTGHTFKTKAE